MTGVDDGPRHVRFGLVAAVGLLAAAVCVLYAAPLQSAGAQQLLGTWWSWTARLAPWRHLPRSLPQGGLLILTAVLILVGAWLLGAWLIVRDRIGTRAVAAVAALWSVPFALAPPVLSRDVYAYLAQGAVAGNGGSPYGTPSSVLGDSSPLLHAVDPLYRSKASPYGPLAVRLFAFALHVTDHHAVAALAVLRVVAVLSLALATWCCARMVSPERRAVSVWLVAGSPLVLLHLIGGLHLETVLCALLAAALLLHLRGASRAAAVVVVLAAAVKVTAIVVLAALLLRTLRAAGLRGVLRDLGAAVGTVVALGLLLQPDPLGWLPALKAPLEVWNPISIPTAAALGWATVIGHAPFAAIGPLRFAVGAVGVLLGGWYCLTSKRRPVAATAGLLLAAMTVTGPVLWPWYLAPAVVCLVIGGGSSRLAVAIGLSCAGALSALPLPVVQMQRVSVAGGLLVAVCLGLLLVRSRRAPTPAVGWQ